ncbi:hypothetical protein [Dyella sp. RRB7]|uniref:hypothetical protein n=1 Tax=Dyella sp. RRB7 TaxID=2919502 RepID=UPI001FAA110D|nr:hypothetical protein [Dyella sp. RRB7]
MDADAQDLTTMQHSVDASSSSRDGSGGGDALGLSREGASPSSPSSSSSNDNCPSQTPPAAAPRSRRATIGWQSLLPGSIQ